MMPNSDRVAQHIREARANYERYQRMLANDSDVSWSLVLLFYSGLHLVQAHAELRRTRSPAVSIPQDHFDRNEYVGIFLPEIAYEYMALQHVSKDVRYRLKKYSLQEVQNYHDTEFMTILDRLAKRSISW